MYKRLDEALLTPFEGGSGGHSGVLLGLIASWSLTRAHRGIVLCTPAASAPPGAPSPVAGSCAQPGAEWCIRRSPR
jgi:hypothetical protein